MNATILSSGTASAAGGVAAPASGAEGGQANGAFQALLAGQGQSQSTGNPGGSAAAPTVTPQPSTPVDGTPGLSVATDPAASPTDPKAFKPAVSRELAQLNPELRSVASELDTAFGQLRALFSQLRNALAAATDTADASTQTTPGQAAFMQPAATSDNATPATATAVASGTPLTETEPGEQDLLINMLEPLRDQLAALGIDIDTLRLEPGASNIDPATTLAIKTPVQDQILAPAIGKIEIPVQDAIPPAPTAPGGTGDTVAAALSKPRAPEPHRPEAVAEHDGSILHRIAARLDQLQQQLAGAGLPDNILQALDANISTLTVLAERPLPAQLVSPFAQSAPAGTAPSPLPTMPSPDLAAARPATAQPVSAAAADAAPGNPPAETGSKSAPQNAANANALADFAKSAAPFTDPKTAAPASSAPSMPAANGAALPEPAPGLNVAAAAQASRPSSAPGAQLAERIAKPAGASKGIGAPTSTGAAQAASSSPAASSPAAAGPTTAIDTATPELRPMAPAPGQASVEQPPVQSQTSADPGLTFRPEQDLSLQRAEGRLAAERATNEGQRFTPQSAQQLAAQITKRFANGSRVFDIRLDPAELGRVDVRLELSQDQRVQAILTAERPETLAELQRSARDLERALHEAGLELEQDGLEFQLNENPDDQGYNADEDPDVMPVFVESDDLELAALASETAIERDAYGFRLAAARDRLDVRI